MGSVPSSVVGSRLVVGVCHWKERAFRRQFRRSVPTDPHGEPLLCRRVYNRYAILVGLAMRRAELSKSKICTLQCCAVADQSLRSWTRSTPGIWREQGRTARLGTRN